LHEAPPSISKAFAAREKLRMGSLMSVPDELRRARILASPIILFAFAANAAHYVAELTFTLY
jgi:hypothetical protein